MRCAILLLLTVVVALAGPKPGEEGTPEHARAAELVKQLGHPRFAVRESAAKQLLDMGGPAIPALTAGTKAADEEVRTRSAALLPKVRAAEWKKRAEAYLADTDGKQKHDLPLLAEFEKAVGKPTPESRKLIAEMLKANGELLYQAATDPNAAIAAVRVRCRTLAGAVGADQKQVKAEVGDLAALFFVHAQVGKDSARWGNDDHPAHLLANPGLAEGMESKDLGPAVRRVLAHWANTRPRQDLTAHQFFALLVRTKPFPEAVPNLARLAKDKTASGINVRALAIEALGKVGDKDANAALDGLLSDSTSLFQGVVGRDFTVADCAFAALLTAHKKNPSDYGMSGGLNLGFRFAGNGEIVRITLHTFPSDEARQNGLKKWKDEAKKK
jgi:glutathione S-transferase